MSVIDEIKQKTDIVEIIGQYVTLKKSGRNLSAPCPFHSEKHPSFFVYPEQQSWHCFGACNTGGDVFSFLMKKEGYDFSEALHVLAERAGVELPSFTARSAGEKEFEDIIFRAGAAAAAWFHNNLLNTVAAEKARAYIASRGYTRQTIIDFSLGYSPNEWEALKHYLMEKGFDEKTLVEAGLLYKNEDGRTTDRFRGKLIIPIKDSRGRVTGFGARVLDDSLPKYVNSPQTRVFDKSGILFGLDRAAAKIKEQDKAIIMEGYMDVITAHQNGFTNAVAAMGTAITEAQVNIVKKLSRNLVLAMDADAAGEEAMRRTVAHENLLGTEIRVIVLPEGKDPDDVIRENPKVWEKLADTSIPLLDFMFNRSVAGLDLTQAADKSKLTERLLPFIAGMNDPVRQSHYLQKLASLVNVDLNTIKTALVRQKQKTSLPRSGSGTRKTPLPQIRVAADAREDYILAMLLHYPGLTESQEIIQPDYFFNTENRELYRVISTNREPYPDNIESIRETIDTVLHERFDNIAAKTLPQTRTAIEQKYFDCVTRLKERYVKTLAARKAASTAGNDETALLEEDIKLSAQLRELDLQKTRKARAQGDRL